MNKNSAKKRPTKATKLVSSKPSSSARKPASSLARKPEAAVRKPTPVRTMVVSPVPNVVVSPPLTPAHLAYRRASLRAHKFEVGENVFYTSSPISRPGASGTYKVVKQLPSDGDDYQYRIKNPGEAFERVAKESQLEGGDH
jgi:hypothetical protein